MLRTKPLHTRLLAAAHSNAAHEEEGQEEEKEPVAAEEELVAAEEEEEADAHRNAAEGEYAVIDRVWCACASLARCHPLLQVSSA